MYCTDTTIDYVLILSRECVGYVQQINCLHSRPYLAENLNKWIMIIVPQHHLSSLSMFSIWASHLLSGLKTYLESLQQWMFHLRLYKWSQFVIGWSNCKAQCLQINFMNVMLWCLLVDSWNSPIHQTEMRNTLAHD